MLASGIRNPTSRAGTNLDDDTWLPLPVSGLSSAMAPTANSERVRNSRGGTAVGPSTDMTRRSRDIDTGVGLPVPSCNASLGLPGCQLWTDNCHLDEQGAISDEHRDIRENMAPFQSRNGLIGTGHATMTSPRPFRYNKNTRRSTRKDLQAFPSQQLEAADQIIDGFHTGESVVLSPRVAPRGYVMPKKLEKLNPRSSDTFTPRFGQYSVWRESADSKSLPIQREKTRAAGTGPSQRAEQLLLLSGINPSTLDPENLATFKRQSLAVQQKTIQINLRNMQQQQSQRISKPMPDANSPPRQDLPIVTMAPNGANINHFYNAEGMAVIPPGAIRGPSSPIATQEAGGSNHALGEFPTPRNFRKHHHDKLDSQKSEAFNNAMFKVPLARQKSKLPGYGRGHEPKDNDSRSTTNATISRDHTIGAEDIVAERLRILGSKMKGLVPGPSLSADSDSDTSGSTLSRSSTLGTGLIDSSLDV